MSHIIVAIDGPAASGKSSVSKIIANKLNFSYIDTGAMYRCITLLTLENNVSPDDEETISKLLDKCNIHFQGTKCFLNGKDVTLEIRNNEVTKHVSQVCAYKDVREHMANAQREMGNLGNVILDGRDIGTNVFPNAEVKIFLTAPVKERAKRRYIDNLEKGIPSSIEELEIDIARRDHYDSNRAIAPLTQAKDAIYIDNSDMNLEQTAEYIINIIKERTGVK